MNQTKQPYFNQEEYDALKDEAVENGIHIVHTQIYSPFVTKRTKGFTLAWRRCADFANGRMIEVAVAYCSPKDMFRKRIGAYTALANFADGNTVMLPLGSADPADIVNRLRQTFGAAVFY